MATDATSATQLIQDAISGASGELGISGPIESFYNSIGLMTGPYALYGRAAVGFGAPTALMLAVKPSFAFDPRTGAARPWALLSSTADATLVPWWAPGVAGVLLSAVFT